MKSLAILFVFYFFVVSCSNEYDYTTFESDLELLYSFEGAKSCLEQESIFKEVKEFYSKDKDFKILGREGEWNFQMDELFIKAHQRIEVLKEKILERECYCCYSLNPLDNLTK